METWLITGAQGFIGRYLVDCIARERPADGIVGIGLSPQLENSFSHRITTPHGKKLAPLPPSLAERAKQLEYHPLDVTDAADLCAFLRNRRPAKIVHLASGLRGDARPDLLHINVEGTAALFEAIGKIDGYQPKVILGSTGGVYGETCGCRLPLRETMACEPLDEYSVTKLAAELLARIYADRLGAPLAIARIFNVLGAGQDERHVAGRMALELVKRRCGRGELVEMGSLSSTRDFVDVRDVARALFLLAVDGEARGIFNVASGVERSVAELWEQFLAASGVRVKVSESAGASHGVQRHFAGIERLLARGFQPASSFASSVSSLWQYYGMLWSA